MVTTISTLFLFAVLFALQVVKSQNLLNGNNNAFYFCSFNKTALSAPVPITDQIGMTESGNTYMNVSADTLGFCLTPLDCSAPFDSYTIVFNITNPISPKSILPVLAKAMT